MKPAYWDELQSILDSKKPAIVEAHLRQEIESPIGNVMTWVLVEGDADPWFYDKFFKRDKAKVVKTGKKRSDGKVRGGYSAVIEVLNHLLRDNVTDKVIGVIDRDYRDFDSQRTIDVPQVFLTDHRDLEMTMLFNAKIRENLKSEILSTMDARTIRLMDLTHNYDDLWQKCINFCRFLGYIYIAGASRHLPVRFEFKKSLYWDNESHNIHKGAKRKVYQDMFLQCWRKHRILTPWGVRWTYMRKNLVNQNDWDVCRGHDFMGLFSAMLIDSAHYSPLWITFYAAKEYTPNMIHDLTMYKDIKNWQDKKGLDILV